MTATTATTGANDSGDVADNGANNKSRLPRCRTTTAVPTVEALPSSPLAATDAAADNTNDSNGHGDDGGVNSR